MEVKGKGLFLSQSAEFDDIFFDFKLGDKMIGCW